MTWMRSLLPFLVLAACAPPGERFFAVVPDAHVAEAKVAVKADRLVYDVEVDAGDAEFRSDDAIVIDSVRGTSPIFERGGTYRIAGHYRLASIERASLLASVTVTKGSGRSTTAPNSQVKVARGQGTFVLELTLHRPGYPHLTFYSDEGDPVGGVYFGTNEWLLREKGWSYFSPRVGKDLANPDAKSVEL